MIQSLHKSPHSQSDRAANALRVEFMAAFGELGLALSNEELAQALRDEPRDHLMTALARQARWNQAIERRGAQLPTEEGWP